MWGCAGAAWMAGQGRAGRHHACSQALPARAPPPHHLDAAGAPLGLAPLGAGKCLCKLRVALHAARVQASRRGRVGRCLCAACKGSRDTRPPHCRAWAALSRVSHWQRPRRAAASAAASPHLQAHVLQAVERIAHVVQLVPPLQQLCLELRRLGGGRRGTSGCGRAGGCRYRACEHHPRSGGDPQQRRAQWGRRARAARQRGRRTSFLECGRALCILMAACLASSTPRSAFFLHHSRWVLGRFGCMRCLACGRALLWHRGAHLPPTRPPHRWSSISSMLSSRLCTPGSSSPSWRFTFSPQLLWRW